MKKSRKLLVSDQLQLAPEQIKLLGQFIVFCEMNLPIQRGYTVKIVGQRKPHRIGTTAAYMVGGNECRIYAKNRALVDVMRSVAHEMTHMMQDEQGMIDGPIQDAGGFHEDQANAKAGELIKLFAKSSPERTRIYERKLISGRIL
tara:strand:+ start:85 stop:519 length:435 start_codon:yes stop_codon:yes gene_type:complete